MSDEPARIPEGAEPAHRAPTIMFEHYCEHPGCADWGAFGYARGKGKSHWFCREHRDDGERYL